MRREGPLAGDDSERAASRELREFVDAVQDLRLPIDLPDFAGLAAEADRLDARADALQFGPLDPDTQPAARQAYADLFHAMTAAGAASDGEDHALLRAELAAS